MAYKVVAIGPDGKKAWVILPDGASPEVISSAVAAYLSTHPVTVDQSGKVDKVTGKSLVADLEIAKIHAPNSDNQDLSGLVSATDPRLSDARTPKTHTHTNDHAPGSDNQDLSGLQPKETGKGLYPDADATKLAGIAVNANNYSHPANHSPSIITQDSSNRFVTDAEKTTWAASHTWKTGIATKNITDVSAVQNIAHGLGRVPKFVRIDGAVIISTAITQMCTGVFDGTNNNGLSVCIGEGTSTVATDAVYTSTSIALGFSPLVATNVFTGANRQTGIISVDATNIIITWTKTGTVASLTASLIWQCT